MVLLTSNETESTLLEDSTPTTASATDWNDFDDKTKENFFKNKDLLQPVSSWDRYSFLFTNKIAVGTISLVIIFSGLSSTQKMKDLLSLGFSAREFITINTAYADVPTYTQSAYYTQNAYYAQGTYSTGYTQSTYYQQGSYYSQSGYYSQGSYSADSSSGVTTINCPNGGTLTYNDAGAGTWTSHTGVVTPFTSLSQLPQSVLDAYGVTATGAYSQSTYYSEGVYYNQGTYYSQGTYYNQSTYYSQASYCSTGSYTGSYTSGYTGSYCGTGSYTGSYTSSYTGSYGCATNYSGGLYLPVETTTFKFITGLPMKSVLMLGKTLGLIKKE